jgi:ribonucleoside-diphosphate reductase alpha chain
MELDELKENDLAPQNLTEEGLKTLQGGYMLESDTPRCMYRRVSKAAAARLHRPELEEIFFEMFWKSWLGGASPVLSNMGTTRGLPISCYSNHLSDSVHSIFGKQTELAMLSKNGGGVGIYMGDIRGRGSVISGNGKSEGIIPWAKCFDAATMAISQGGVRKGASALYLPIEHLDIEEFLDIRKATGDLNRRVQTLHHAVTIPDSFMERVKSGDVKARELWIKLLQNRIETGEPYILYIDNVNKTNPRGYIDNNLKIRTSNICSEITGYTDSEHTFVCCLSSLNLAKYDEYKSYKFSNGMSVPEASIYFLEGVMEEFIQKAASIQGLECALRFAVKSRMLGLGVLGWHSYLQKHMIPFDSFPAMLKNAEIFSWIQKESVKASQALAKELGEPEWCKGTGMRHTHLTALAPTVSNAIICGGESSSIEPITANAYALKTAKGTFIRKNKALVELLDKKGLTSVEIWDKIIKDGGSVKNIKELSPEEKEVFKTAREINQFALVNQAAQRQKFICQSQSLNLFFTAGASAKYINQVHLEAWSKGVKSLYYLRSETVLKGSVSEYTKEDCKACEG